MGTRYQAQLRRGQSTTDATIKRAKTEDASRRDGSKGDRPVPSGTGRYFNTNRYYPSEQGLQAPRQRVHRVPTRDQHGHGLSVEVALRLW